MRISSVISAILAGLAAHSAAVPISNHEVGNGRDELSSTIRSKAVREGANNSRKRSILGEMNLGWNAQPQDSESTAPSDTGTVPKNPNPNKGIDAGNSQGTEPSPTKTPPATGQDPPKAPTDGQQNPVSPPGGQIPTDNQTPENSSSGNILGLPLGSLGSLGGLGSLLGRSSTQVGDIQVSRRRPDSNTFKSD